MGFHSSFRASRPAPRPLTSQNLAGVFAASGVGSVASSRSRALSGIAAALLAGSVGAPGGPITVAVSASRTSGAAPLAVYFDITGTTASGITGVATAQEVFRRLKFDFDYGDTGAGTWSTTGLSKNADSGGPIGAHVFETPDSYTVAVTATLGFPWALPATGTTYTHAVNDYATHGGNTYRCTSQHTPAAATEPGVGANWATVWALHATGLVQGTAQAGITVSDPDTVYSGTSTVCIDTTGATSGGPAGAAYATSMPTIESNKRYLIKRGQSIAGWTVPRGVGGNRFGAYGAGAKPVVTSTISINPDANPTIDTVCEDIALSDLDVRNAVRFNLGPKHILCLRVESPSTSNGESAFGFMSGSALAFYASNNPSRTIRVPQYVFIVDCYQRGSTAVDNQPHNVSFCVSRYPVFMGNDFRGSFEHVLRISSGQKGLYQHNELQDVSSDGFRHAIKHHSSGITAWPSDPVIPSSGSADWLGELTVIRKNTLGASDSNNDWTLVLAPQNNSSTEGLQDCIIEDNVFVQATAKSQDIVLVGRRLTTRGNRRNDNGTLRITNDATRSYPAEIESNWVSPLYGQYTG